MKTNFESPEYCEFIKKACINLAQDCLHCFHFKVYIQGTKNEQTKAR